MQAHDYIKLIGLLGTLIGLYNGISKSIPLIDFLIIFLVSITLIAVASDMKKLAQKKELELSMPAEELQNGILIRKANGIKKNLV